MLVLIKQINDSTDIRFSLQMEIVHAVGQVLQLLDVVFAKAFIFQMKQGVSANKR